MRVLVIGASGAIGVRLVPRLRERGHEVIGTARSPGTAGQLLTALAMLEPQIARLSPSLLERALALKAVAAAAASERSRAGELNRRR